MRPSGWSAIAVALKTPLISVSTKPLESDAINAVAWTLVTMKRESNEVRIVFSIPGGRQINCGGITTGGALSLNSSIIPGQHENTWVFGVVRSRIGFTNSKP